MKTSAFAWGLLPGLILLASCISEEENMDVIFEQDLQKIEEYIQTVDTEYMRRETVGETGIVLLFTEEVEEGELAEVRDTLAVDYTGKLLDGTVFDTSVEQVAQDNGLLNPNRNYEPYGVILGVSNVINGWHWSLSRMKEGEKAIALIPSAYAYGSQAQGPIPANSVLVFELDLVEVRPHQP
ncbi:FKBP-type peptidyl-prolyl cis-trans isomerase FklB [Cyclobacterium lianum]|uniref:Peptidyl-prolyl cis-trans isomerase n=1 Tax=Cyclobacterium lianum TaxID=388280 RepID=A0A1M7I9A0_9BACT|nr:FKBP-type peptidyl-prolyl cis-trans isomerase [Cyclobacterium lianum]SHM37351.1 FKBP-type peptidyl-prolyl cis-trans isomerase FklB [Cyclobacterium lianum]